MKLPRQPYAQPVKDVEVNAALQNIWQQLARVLNANISFGNPTAGPDNMKGAWFDGTTPVGANTDFTVTHNLGYIPQGWLVIFQDKAASVYQGATTWTDTQIFLRCNTASVHVRLFVIG